VAVGGDASTVFINEIHYDNTSTDTGEAIEIAGPAGTDLSTWSLVLYNGNGGASYNTTALSGLIPDQSGGYGTVVVNYPSNGIQNGPPDGIALVNGGTVVQFLSYEGAFTAAGGPANGMSSTDIGVAETSSTAVGDSLQLTGTGLAAGDFTWATPAANTFGSPNTGQTFAPPPPPLAQIVVNEVIQNPAAVSDANGEWFEVYNAGPGTVDLDGWTIQDNDTDLHVIVNGGPLTIAAGGFLVLGVNGDSTTNGGVAVDYVYGGIALANGADELVLVDTGTNEIDRVEWDDGATFPDPTGASMMLEDPALDNNVGANWCSSTVAFGDGDLGTPGAANGICPPPPAVSIYDIQFTTDTSGDSPWEGVEVTTTGVVTAFFSSAGRMAFIQDGTGPWSGLLLFDPSGFVNVGDELTVEGTVSEFFGMTQIAGGQTTTLSTGNAVPFAEVLPTGDIPQEQWESVFVAAEGVTVTDDNPDAPSDFGEWEIDDTSGPARVDDLGSYTYGPTTGDPLARVQGPLNYAFGNFKIEPRNDSDIIPDAFTIMEIQGTGQFSPHVGKTAMTSGIVTAFSANGRDMWIQDPAGDGDPATSDGIFVDDADRLPGVSVGDHVVIAGEIEEQQFAPALPLTRIDDTVLIDVLSTGNPLPAPVALTDLPNVSIPDGIDFWEALEGMRVSVENGRVVAPTSRFGEFGMLTKKDAKPGSGYEPSVKQILLRSLGPNMVDYNPERILVDDATVADAIQVRPGDKVESLVGIVDYTFGMYKLQPTEFVVDAKGLPGGTVSRRSGGKGDTTITTYNVENLFDLLDEPGKDDGGSTPTAGELETQLTKLTAAIIRELRTPEILVVQEVENTSILQELGDRVNAAAGTGYVAVSEETSDGRGIEVGFLYDDDRVDLVDWFQLSGPDVEAAFGPGSASPGREPLYGLFEVEGREIHIVGNHFKSKGGDDPPFGVNQPFTRVTETQRKMQAQVVRDFVNDIFADDRWAMVMVTGDLNDFQFGEPGEGPDDPVSILEGGSGEVRLINLVNLERRAERYSFIFDGNSQVLDHMLVSPALIWKLRGVDFLHFNASYPAFLSGDPSTQLRASDHDALEGRFKLKRFRRHRWL